MDVESQFNPSKWQLAPFVRRVESALTTLFFYAVFAVVISVILKVIFPVDELLVKKGWPHRHANWIAVAIIWIVPLFIVSLDGADRRATYGMRSRGLEFAYFSGGTISSFRTFLRIATGFVLIPIIPISVVIAICDSLHRTLADRICGTVVVRISEEEET